VLGSLCLLLFAVLTWQEAVHGRLLALDEPLRSAVAGASVHPAHRSAVGYFFADLGNAPVAVPVLVVTLVCTAWRGRRWVPPVACAVAMAAVPLVVIPLKSAIGRGGAGSLAPGYPGLYPSGHTATAALAYGATALLLLPWLKRAAARRLLIAAAVLLNLAVGMALVYCGYHWPLDVIGSWCLCGALLSGAARVSCWSGNRG
jgi:undecaprenyl-diphosphatase